jgi:hypothetical protein
VYNKGGRILKPGDIVAVKHVTVIGHANDFAVYTGRATQSDEHIANYGDKVGESAARAIAPYCSHLRYRH